MRGPPLENRYRSIIAVILASWSSFPESLPFHAQFHRPVLAKPPKLDYLGGRNVLPIDPEILSCDVHDLGAVGRCGCLGDL